MWVMLNDAWLSIVADRDDQEFLLVRSRQQGAIKRVFGIEEDVDTSADYHFRCFIHRDHVAGVLARETLGIQYDNFKNSVKDPTLHRAYTSVWTVGYKMQWDAHHEGVQRRTLHSTIPAEDVDPDLLEDCSWCQESIDLAFHAPEPGQPIDVCESCWRANGQGYLNTFYQEGNEEEDDEAQLSLVN